jgi:hypothetical protein
MNITSTTKRALLTMPVVPIFGGFQPVSERIVAIPISSSDISPRHFKPDFRVIDDKKVVEISSGYLLSQEVEVINSLLEIGNVLFENARNETQTELKAMSSYFKSKYIKV